MICMSLINPTSRWTRGDRDDVVRGLFTTLRELSNNGLLTREVVAEITKIGFNVVTENEHYLEANRAEILEYVDQNIQHYRGKLEKK